MEFGVKLDMPDFSQWADAAQLLPGGRVQKAIDQTILEISSPYTPWRTGQLEHSATNGTKIGTGLLVWAIPYAPILYDKPGLNFNTTHNPMAGAQWAHRAMAADGDKVIAAGQAEIKP